VSDGPKQIFLILFIYKIQDAVARRGPKRTTILTTRWINSNAATLMTMTMT
jgi:hypothetical protein